MSACFLPIDKADKYWRDPWQKNLRNKLENRISVSEPFNDNQRGFNAGDLKKKIAKYVLCTYIHKISITYIQATKIQLCQNICILEIFTKCKYLSSISTIGKMEILHLSAIQFCI